MKKRIFITAIASVALIIAAALSLTNMFTKGTITGKLYRVDNVFE